MILAADLDNPADTLDQADEEILTYTVSDEALEAAAGHGEGGTAGFRLFN